MFRLILLSKNRKKEIRIESLKQDNLRNAIVGGNGKYDHSVQD